MPSRSNNSRACHALPTVKRKGSEQLLQMKAQTSKQTGVEFDDNCSDVDIFAYEQTMCIDVAYDNNCDYFRVTGRAVK